MTKDLVKEMIKIEKEIEKYSEVPVGILEPKGKRRTYAVELYKSDWMDLTGKETISLLKLLLKGFKRFDGRCEGKDD